MKKYNNLFNEICTYENFKLAYKNTIKGKKHYREVKIIERHGARFLKRLLKEVKEGRYRVSEYKKFKLYTGHKWRDIAKLPMKDRIVQHAIMNYVERIFRETFIIDTFSSIKTRGIHLGLSRVKKYVHKTGDKYYLKLDIRKCYQSLDKDILKDKLRKKFKDTKLCNLFDVIIDSFDEGVPIGNYTSQYFNNFYFNDFDHWIKEVKGVKGYFRYCDDMIIIHNDKTFLHSLLIEIQDKIKELNVELKNNYQIYRIEDKGVDFLGYRVYKNKVTIRKATKYNFINKCKKMDFNNLSARDINVLGSYWGIFIHADCRHLWKTYTGAKTFKDLNVKGRDRDFVKNILDKEIIINSIIIYRKYRKKKVRLCVDYDDVKDIYISTSAKMLVEAASQFAPDVYPFKTKITTNNKNYYIFT